MGSRASAGESSSESGDAGDESSTVLGDGLKNLGMPGGGGVWWSTRRWNVLLPSQTCVAGPRETHEEVEEDP